MKILVVDDGPFLSLPWGWVAAGKSGAALREK
jgi:hypothetical protein